jgi:hypothetical protein
MLGRKALEANVLKKTSSSSRGSNYPRGRNVVGEYRGLSVVGDGVPGAGQATKLALRSAAIRTEVAGEAAGGGSGDRPTPGNQPGVLRLSADPRPAPAPGTDVRS